MTEQELYQQYLKETGQAKPSEQELYQQYLKEVRQPAQQKSRPIEAFVSGLGKGATFGYLPQIQAATEPLIQGALDLIGGGSDAQLKAQGFNIQPKEESYTQRRDKAIAEQLALQESNPYASTTGELAGAISGGFASGAPLTKLLGVPAATGLGRLGQAAATGAITGAIRNPGDVQGEVSPIQAGERASNIASDALTGAIFQGGLEAIGKTGKFIRNAGKGIDKSVQKYAFEAVSPSKAVSTKAVKDRSIYKVGQTIIDNNLIQPGAGVEDILVNTEQALKKSGDRIGGLYDALDNNPSLAIKKEDIKNIATDYAEKASERLSGTVDGENVARKLNKVIKTIPENANFSDLRKWRASIDDQINFSKANKDLPGYQQELLKLRNEVQDKIANLAGKVNPEYKSQFVRENKNFANLSRVKEMAENKSAANVTNTNFGIREGFGAGIGALVGSSAGPAGTAIGAATGGLTANALKKYGAPFVAMTASKIAKGLENNPKIMGAFSEPLIRASQVSPQQFVTTVNALIKDPEFKKQLEALK